MKINVERVDRAEVQALVNRWLSAEIAEDGYLREAPDGDFHAGVILKRCPPGVPDILVRALDHEALIDFEEQSLAEGQYLLRNVTELELRRSAQRKTFEEAALRHAKVDENIAEEHVKALFQRHGIPVDEFSGQFETATRMMLRAHRDVLQVIEARDSCAWRPILDDDPAQSLIDRLGVVSTPLERQPPMPAPRAEKLGVAAKVAFLAIAKREGLSAKRVEDYEAAVRVFLDFLADDPDIFAVTAQQAGAFMRALQVYPSNASKRAPYRDLPNFTDKLAAAEAAGEKMLLSPATINGKYLMPLKALYEWYKGSDPAVLNPFANIRAESPKRADPEKRRRNFSNTEVSRLLGLPLFTGSSALGGKGLYEVGPRRVNDWRFWVPLICLFSGMRLNEACGLAVADIRLDQGVDYFHVRDDLEGQRLKTSAARRRVPIHSSLIEVGLIQFVDQLRAKSCTRLFEELRLDEEGYFSRPASKFFQKLRRWYEDAEPEEPGSLTFHSTRHTVITRLRSAEVREDVAKELVGHEQGDVHATYGTFELKGLQAAIDKISYGALDLSQVRQPYAAPGLV